MVSGQRKKKYVTSMSSTLEPAIWPCDTDQQIPCVDSRQLTRIWVSNMKVYQGEAAFLSQP